MLEMRVHVVTPELLQKQGLEAVSGLNYHYLKTNETYLCYVHCIQIWPNRTSILRLHIRDCFKRTTLGRILSSLRNDPDNHCCIF